MQFGYPTPNMEKEMKAILIAASLLAPVVALANDDPNNSTGDPKPADPAAQQPETAQPKDRKSVV